MIKNIQIENEIFVEFGVENYMESNTRFLMMNNNWSGLVMDGSDEAIKSIRKREWFWAANPARIERWEYPLDAIREIVLNSRCAS